MNRWLFPSIAIAACSALFVCSSLPAQDKDKPAFKLSKEEQQILDMTNQARAEKNLHPLKISPLLTKIARGHSANMAKQGKLQHTLDGKDPIQRINEAGYRFWNAGENIAWGSHNYPVVKTFEDWMESVDHRKNILRKEFTEIGIARVVDEKGDFWYTQVFGRPR